jgi:ribonuclease HII
MPQPLPPWKMTQKIYIIGADEVGYGSLAGPLVVAAVRAPLDWQLDGLDDSKKLKKSSEKKLYEMRDKLLKLVEDGTITWHMAERSNVQIDKWGVAKALKDAYVECFHKLYQDDSRIITDGILKFDGFGVDDYDKMSLIKADAQVPHCMAASILAKTYRDKLMKEVHHPKYPQYGWDGNVGYWHKDHVAAIEKLGPTPLHRWSYDPVKSMNIPNPNQLTLDFKDGKPV